MSFMASNIDAETMNFMVKNVLFLIRKKTSPENPWKMSQPKVRQNRFKGYIWI